jgi:hypothetical protein
MPTTHGFTKVHGNLMADSAELGLAHPPANLAITIDGKIVNFSHVGVEASDRTENAYWLYRERDVSSPRSLLICND